MVFINILGYIGSVIVESLRNDHINHFDPKVFHGTISEKESQNPIPRGVTEMYKV